MGTQTFQKYRPSVDWEQSSEGLVVSMEVQEGTQIIDFDTYVIGVLGAILNPETHEETAKAMAVVLRTYLYSMAGDRALVRNECLGLPQTTESQRQQKGLDASFLKNAIKETEGCMILYNDMPILPLYHAMSNGKTRDFSEVWHGELPYLVGVESAWDKSAPDYIQKVKRSKSQWQKAWGESLNTASENVDFSGQWTAAHMQIVEKDSAGYVKQIQIGAEMYSGEEVRCRLGLPSACFEYEVHKQYVEFTCYGDGHGVGLSIYGANVMAEEGKTWQEILAWYYPGTQV